MLPQQQQRQRGSGSNVGVGRNLFFFSYTSSKSCELTSKPAYDGVAATQRTTATATPAYIHFTHRGGKRAWKFAKRVAHEHEHERKAGNRTTGIVNREVIHMRSLRFVSLNVCVYVCAREWESKRTAAAATALPLLLLVPLLRPGSSCTFTRISPTFSLVPFLAAVALRTIF